MPHTCCLLMPSTYRDSVVLMQLSQTLDQLPGVQQAAVMMGAPQNKALLQDAGLLTTEGKTASANDLLICVRAESILAAEAAIREAEQHVAHRQATVDDAGETAPRTQINRSFALAVLPIPRDAPPTIATLSASFMRNSYANACQLRAYVHMTGHYNRLWEGMWSLFNPGKREGAWKTA